jgi:hypothetical protein
MIVPHAMRYDRRHAGPHPTLKHLGESRSGDHYDEIGPIQRHKSKPNKIGVMAEHDLFPQVEALVS